MAWKACQETQASGTAVRAVQPCVMLDGTGVMAAAIEPAKSTTTQERAVELSQRLQELPPYHFAEYARKLAEKRAAGVDVINLSIGDPDLPTPPEVLNTLDEAAREPGNQRYPEYAGMP